MKKKKRRTLGGKVGEEKLHKNTRKITGDER